MYTDWEKNLSVFKSTFMSIYIRTTSQHTGAWSSALNFSGVAKQLTALPGLGRSKESALTSRQPEGFHSKLRDLQPLQDYLRG